MIQQSYINHWRATQAPWSTDAYVEHDLVLSRALIELFSQSLISETMALRGGTALNKIHLKKFGRFSEDIDLVQIKPGENGPFIDVTRACLDPLFGAPKRKIGEGVTTLTYKFTTTDNLTLKLKIETNTREHKSFLPLIDYEFNVDSGWYSGKCIIKSYSLEELLSTKLRALYQRKKGRDLYDLWATANELKIDYATVIRGFYYYLKHEGLHVSKKELEENLNDKLQDKTFLDDIQPLLQSHIGYDSQQAAQWFTNTILSLIEVENA